MSIDKIQLAKAVVEQISANQLTARLIGGLGVYYQCPRIVEMGFGRSFHDLDLVGLSHQNRQLTRTLEDFGFTADRRFNAAHGERRLLFSMQDGDETIDLDVFLDVFEMCHTIKLKDRLQIDPLTLSISDLLLTKLQIIRLTSKDASDTLALLAHHEIGDSDEMINMHYIGRLISDDWGLYTTIRDNLVKLPAFLDEFATPKEDREIILDRINHLIERIDSQKKTLKWKLRNKIGRRILWYELPDEKTL